MIQCHFKTHVNCDCVECVMRRFDPWPSQSKTVAMNEKYQAHVVATITAINKAIVLLGVLAVFVLVSIPEMSKGYRAESLNKQETSVKW